MAFNELVKQIKKRRERLNVTQEILADISGVGLRTIKHFESGKGNPTLNTLQRICDVLGLEIQLKVKMMNNENS